MENREKVEHIKGRYNILKAVITGLFSLIAGGIVVCKVVERVVYVPERNLQNQQIVELQQEVAELQSSYTALLSEYDAVQAQNEEWMEKYGQLEKQYNDLLHDTDNQTANQEQPDDQNQKDGGTAGTATSVVWIDQIEPFFEEGISSSGGETEGYWELWNGGNQKDSLGNDHNHGICIRCYRGDTYAIEYVLEEACSGVKGIFTLEFESRNIQIENTLKVFSIDDNYEKHLLYSTEQPLRGGIKPIAFDVPFDTNLDHLRIEVSSGDGEWGEFFVALVDTCFY